MRILVVKLAALGDVLRTTSLLGSLRRRHPSCEIVWATSRAAGPLLENNPDIQRIVAVEDARFGREFDLVLSLEEDEQAAALARSACRGELFGIYPEGGRLRYTPSSAPYYDMSLLARAPDGSMEKADGLKAANRLTYGELWHGILGLGRPSGAVGPALFLTAAEKEGARSLAAGAVGVNPGAGARWPAKQISVDKAVSLLSALKTLGRPLVLFGGKDEAERNAEIARRVPGAIDAGTRHDLRAFAALVGRCDAVLTTDSLAFHVAAALGKGVAVLVGPTSSAELDGGPRCVKLTPEAGCSCFYRPRCRYEVSCLDRIPEEAAVEAVRRCLS